MTSNEPVEMQCGKLAVRIARDSNDSDYPWNVQITRNGYQWSGNPCNDELLLMLHDAIEEVIPHLLTAHETNGWRPVETANISALFSRAEWVLIHTSDGRVTEGTPHYFDNGEWCWMAARGDNCVGSEPSMLRDRVLHWMPLPAMPHQETGEKHGG